MIYELLLFFFSKLITLNELLRLQFLNVTELLLVALLQDLK